MGHVLPRPPAGRIRRSACGTSRARPWSRRAIASASNHCSTRPCPAGWAVASSLAALRQLARCAVPARRRGHRRLPAVRRAAGPAGNVLCRHRAGCRPAAGPVCRRARPGATVSTSGFVDRTAALPRPRETTSNSFGTCSKTAVTRARGARRLSPCDERRAGLLERRGDRRRAGRGGGKPVRGPDCGLRHPVRRPGAAVLLGHGEGARACRSSTCRWTATSCSRGGMPTPARRNRRPRRCPQSCAT